MQPSDLALLRAQVASDEGLRLFPYRDVAGRLSIGYGHNLTDRGITQLQASAILDDDLTVAIQDLYRTFPFVMDLDGVRQICLANLAFNLGISRLSKFVKMWAALRATPPDFNTAAAELLNSEYAQQVGARAMRIASALQSGELKS
jgi:lysozyme